MKTEIIERACPLIFPIVVCVFVIVLCVSACVLVGPHCVFIGVLQTIAAHTAVIILVVFILCACKS